MDDRKSKTSTSSLYSQINYIKNNAMYLDKITMVTILSIVMTNVIGAKTKKHDCIKKKHVFLNEVGSNGVTINLDVCASVDNGKIIAQIYNIVKTRVDLLDRPVGTTWVGKKTVSADGSDAKDVVDAKDVQNPKSVKTLKKSKITELSKKKPKKSAKDEAAADDDADNADDANNADDADDADDADEANDADEAGDADDADDADDVDNADEADEDNNSTQKTTKTKQQKVSNKAVLKKTPKRNFPMKKK